MVGFTKYKVFVDSYDGFINQRLSSVKLPNFGDGVVKI
jgi:hypothetical protein